MEMRRKDLAVTEKEQIDAIIQSCDCVRLAFADGTHPYIVPLSFGYHRENGVSKFYFHSAAAGRKVELCRKLGYAGFELDTNRQLKPDEKPCDFSVAYQSVVGEGTITELKTPEEKTAGDVYKRQGHYRPEHGGREAGTSEEIVVVRAEFCPSCRLRLLDLGTGESGDDDCPVFRGQWSDCSGGSIFPGMQL